MTARPDRGSALVLALMVTFIVSLLGVSFLLMAQTESRIARNETRAAQTLYMADSGARVVRGWFDRPGVALGFPLDATVVDRSARQVIDETDPYGQPPTAGAGLYKQDPLTSVDLDLDENGLPDLFQRPFRGGVALEHSLMGTEEWPDMRIDDADPTTPAYAFLDTLSQTLFGTPVADVAFRWRISNIVVYAPPYVQFAGNWARYGMGTIKVTARIYGLDAQGNEDAILAEHTTTSVINEIPYGTPVYGPVHTCADLTFAGNLSGHWGPVTAQGDIWGYTAGTPNIAPSLPRSAPPGPRVDRLWVSLPSEGDCLREYTKRVQPVEPVTDPWLRVIALGRIDGAPAPLTEPDQPYPPAANVYPSGTCNALNVTPTFPCCDRSNLSHNHPLVLCPEYDYRFWKNLAMSGRRDVHYYVPDGTGRFLENGVAPARSFEEATELSTNGSGLFFFDTADQRAPHDDDSDGTLDNLSQTITIDGSTWQSAGFIYLNSTALTLNNLSAPPVAVTLRAPGEPFLDADGDRSYDPGEAWINLAYPGALATPFNVDPLEDSADDGLPSGTGPVRNTLGPPSIPAQPSFYGILHTSGTFTASGPGIIFGSVIARGNVVLGAGGSAPDIYWDDRIAHEWPPTDMNLPRVTETRWIDEP